MARDRVKTELARSVDWGIRNMMGGLVYKLADHNVTDIDVTQVSELETQVKVMFRGIPPRYFTVKVSEKI